MRLLGIDVVFMVVTLITVIAAISTCMYTKKQISNSKKINSMIEIE